MPGRWKLLSEHSFDLEAGKTLKLLTAGKYCDRDIVVNAVGGDGSTSDVPEGYTRLQYVVSDGNQFINWGFNANQDTRIVLDIEPQDNGVDNWFFDGRHSAQKNSFGIYRQYTLATKPVYSDYGTSRIQIANVPQGRIVIDFNKNVVTVGGITVTHQTQTFQSEYPLHLLCINSAGTTKGYIPGKTYEALAFANGVPIRSCVPVIHNATGEAGFLDRVNGVFYPSAGTQPFVAGPTI